MTIDTSKIEKIYLVTTGGTIEKTYDESNGLLVNYPSEIQNRLLPKLRLPYSQIEVKKVLAKDSLDMNDEDRKILVGSLRELAKEGRPILVLHGTDTMDLSVTHCQEQIPQEEIQRPIVFTGAMRPLEFENSDALQNIIEGLMVCRLVTPGLYLSFHGRTFKGPSFIKNFKTMTFDDKN